MIRARGVARKWPGAILAALALSFLMTTDVFSRNGPGPAQAPPPKIIAIPNLDLNQSSLNQNGQYAVAGATSNTSQQTSSFFWVSVGNGPLNGPYVLPAAFTSSTITFGVNPLSDDVTMYLILLNPDGQLSNVYTMQIVGLDDAQEAPEVIAKLRLDAAPAPALFPTYVVEGTVPLPLSKNGECLVPPSEAASDEPFHVLVDGELYPADVHPVVRGNDGCAKVVEVVARIPNTGNTVIDVVNKPHPTLAPGPLTDPIDVLKQVQNVPQVVHATVLDNTQSLYVETSDPEGNVYRLPILESASKETKIRGDYKAAARFAGMLMPVAPSGKTLPHSLGLKAYVTVKSDCECVKLDLVFHNATAGFDPADPQDDPIKALYLRDGLRLGVPKGWTVHRDLKNPYEGDTTISLPSPTHDAYMLIEPMADGTLHYVPWQMSFLKPLVLCPPGSQAKGEAMVRHEDGLAFNTRGTDEQGQPLASWWEKATPFYSPLEEPLPHFDHHPAWKVKQGLAAEYQVIKELIELGVSGDSIHDEELAKGPFPTVYNLGSFGSTRHLESVGDIHTVNAGDPVGIRWNEAFAYALRHRNRHHLLKPDGNPVTQSDVLVKCPAGSPYPQGQTVQFHSWKMKPKNPSNFAFDPIAISQANTVVAQGKQPFYMSKLSNDDYGFLQSIYVQKFIRVLMRYLPLIYLTNDPVSKDEVMMYAELARLTFSDVPRFANGGCAVDPEETFLHEQVQINAKPGAGVGIYGFWAAVYAPALAYAIADDAWRAKFQPYFDMAVDVMDRGQTCLGAWENKKSPASQLPYKTRHFVVMNNTYDAVKTLLPLYAKTPLETTIHAMLSKAAYGYLIHDNVWDAQNHSAWAHLATEDLNGNILCAADVPADGKSHAGHEGAWEPGSAHYIETHLGVDEYHHTGNPAALSRVNEALYGNMKGLSEQDVTAQPDAQYNQFRVRSLRLGQELDGQFE